MTFGSKINHYATILTHDTKVQKQGLIALALLVSIAGGAALYYRHRVSNEQQAQKVFSEALAEYHKAVQSDQESGWEEIEKLWKAAYQQHGSTLYGPYFLAFQAEAAMRQGKTEQALNLMDSAISGMSAKSPLYYVYAIKKALMGLDSNQAELQQKALTELTALAEDKHNPQKDEARYYLGYTAWSRHQAEEARQIWAPLLKQDASVWSRKVQALLTSL
jgi:tetratricopeptide (TPR) repeat protein